MSEASSPAASVLIVGGGASGVILAAHLLRQGAAQVTVVEKRPELGRGIAYSTAEPDHLLNVRAANMSALADEPRHFADWLGRRGIDADMNDFYAPRRLYARYLGDLAAQWPDRLRHVRATAESAGADGDGAVLRLDDGSALQADRLVLATGHEENPMKARAYAVRLGAGDDAPLDPQAPVLIVGTGLSTVDVWLSLQRRGHRGPVLALSRRGLLPLGHRRWGEPAPLARPDLPLGASPALFLGWLRARARAREAAGGDWRAEVDALRPFNQTIWQSWSLPERQRFLRHAKTPWHIHRHRMAPLIARRIAAALQEGNFRVVAGRLRSVEAAAGGCWRVLFRPKGAETDERFEAARIYDCSGVATDPAESTNPLVRSLLAGGLARPDRARIGLDVTESCALVGADGAASNRLFAIGPLTRGTFLEIEAVPDIRVQCAGLAQRLAGEGQVSPA